MESEFNAMVARLEEKIDQTLTEKVQEIQAEFNGVRSDVHELKILLQKLLDQIVSSKEILTDTSLPVVATPKLNMEKEVMPTKEGYDEMPTRVGRVEVVKHFDIVCDGFTEVQESTDPLKDDILNIASAEDEVQFSTELDAGEVSKVLRGLKYVHSANVLHRDFKPSNLLMNVNCDLKIEDFELARTTPETDFMTTAIDIWSVGCILDEIVTRQSLFPGKDYVLQLKLITELIGSSDNSSLGFLRSDNTRRYVRQLPQVNEALCHPFLTPLHNINEESVCRRPFSFDFEQLSFTEENIKEHCRHYDLREIWVFFTIQNLEFRAHFMGMIIMHT